MSNKFLGQFLLEKGLIKPEQLLSAIDIQREHNPPIGKIAIDEGFIDEQAANQINAEQQRTDQRFGELATSMGHMTEQQVSQLFHTQNELKKLLGEVLVEQDFIEEETLRKELVEHAKLRETSMLEIDSQVKEHRYCPQISHTLDALVKCFTRIPKIHVKIVKVEPTKPTQITDQKIISQTMHVPSPIKVGWIMHMELMQKIANNFLGIDVGNEEEIYVDAVSEFLNIIMGNALSYNGEEQTKLEPPQVQACDSDYQGEYSQAFCVTIAAGQDEFTLFFLHDT